MEKLVEAVTEELNRYSGVPPFRDPDPYLSN